MITNNMDKAEFYIAIPRFFSGSVVSWKCGVPHGQLISGSQVADYGLLCISDRSGNEEVAMWVSGFQNKVPNAEIRVGTIQQKMAGMTELEHLLNFPFSSFVISFTLDEAAVDVKNRLSATCSTLNPQLMAKIKGLIDGAIADYNYSK